MKRTGLLAAAVFGLYLLVAVLITWPLIAQFSSVFAGFVYGDAYETAHHVWWFTEALRSGQSPFFQSLLAWPNGLEGVTQWADPLHFFPAWLFAFALPLPAAINLQTLLSLALNGLAMWALMRWLLGPHPLSLSQVERETPTPDGSDGGARCIVPLQTTPADPEALTPDPSATQAESGEDEPHPPTPSPWGEGENATAPDGADGGARCIVPLQTTPADPSPEPLCLRAAGRGEVRVELPAFLAGLVFAIYPAFQGQLGAGHTGLLALWPPTWEWFLRCWCIPRWEDLLTRWFGPSPANRRC